MVLRPELGSGATEETSAAMKRLLIVDDDPMVLRSLARAMGALLSDDWEIHQAASPAVAIYIASRQSYRKEDREQTNYHPPEIDVVLSDFVMGEYNGVQVLAEFKKHSPSTLRLMSSGLPAEEIQREAAGFGAVVEFFWPKPLDPKDLAHMLEGE